MPELVVGEYLAAPIQFYGWDSEFNQMPFGPTELKSPESNSREGCRYVVIGKVVHAERQLWAIDFGLVAFSLSSPPRYATAGSWVTGEISIGVPDCPYDQISRNTAVLDRLANRVTIKEILLNVTPWFETGTDGCLSRDILNKHWRSVSRTNAQFDDDGHAEYEVVVELVDG